MAGKFKINFKLSKPKLSKPLKKWIIPAGIIVLLLIGAGGFFLYRQANLAKAAGGSGSTLNTAQVRIGDLTLSAAGSGTLVAGQQADLAFPVAGKVASVSVKVGDQVTSGQALAELADTTSLKASLATADYNLKVAQQTLDNLSLNASAALAEAKSAVVTAQEAYDDAKNTVKKEGMARCDTDTTEAYKERWEFLKSRLDSIQEMWDGEDPDYYLDHIVPAKDEADVAEANYIYCQKYFESEIVASDATLATADVALKQAQATLDTLQANNGIDPVEKAKAEADVAQAQVTYDTAESNLENAKLVAPFDGTVLSVAGQAGNIANTDTFISIIDLSHPSIEFSVDESDMDKIAIGNAADVVFDAIPDDTFTGKVSQVTPQLISSGGYQVLTGEIQLELTDAQSAEELIEGLNASVEVISADAKGAVLVPLDALRDIGDGQYCVFVVGLGGTLKMQTVTIGIQDDYYAQVLSGLEGGETVSTGLVETK